MRGQACSHTHTHSHINIHVLTRPYTHLCNGTHLLLACSIATMSGVKSAICEGNVCYYECIVVADAGRGGAACCRPQGANSGKYWVTRSMERERENDRGPGIWYRLEADAGPRGGQVFADERERPPCFGATLLK